LKLQYGYANGILQSINDASSGVAYWKANTVNPRGQVTQATLGNGIVINRGFDAVTGWQGTSQAGSGGGTALQNNAYLFDYVGNVTQRQDNNQGLTENFYYDAVNRLSYSALDGTTNLTMGYDLLGNITSRSDINSGVAWTYDPVHKHQVTSAGTGYAFTYDPNGNMVTGRGGTISWYSYNLPYVISNSAGTAQFYYGPSHQFYEEVDNGPVTTIYIGGLLQKKFISSGYTEYRHLIKADGALIEVDKTTGTNSDTYYITQDHIGSSSVVTNSAAAVLVDESFGAWGARRGSNWTGSPSTPDNNAIANTTNIGFTGQTMLDSVKMIHMNGRVYDRVIGRFLSADPTIPDPGNTQSFNRYSYVVNSPLTFVDPSGFCYTGGYAKCLPYGSGHSDRNNLVGPADSSRSISGSGFGEGAIGNYSFYGMTTDASDWYTAGDVPVTFTYSVDFGDSSSSSGTDSIGDSASQSFSGGGIRGATFCWLGPISGAKSDV
jgi:RHS repeat-associated protein